MFDLKIEKARGELELHGKNGRGYFVKYVKGNFTEILRKLEENGIPVERDVLIFI